VACGALRPTTAPWAAEIGIPAYAIDEQTAVKVVDGSVEVVSEGQWTKFDPSPVVNAGS
jgi:hypothetical protein